MDGRACILRGNSGPPNIQGALSTTYVGGGQAAFLSYGTRQANSYTYEWWFNTSSSNRGVLFSMQSLVFPFNGILVQINMRNQQNVQGSIQFTETDSAQILNSKPLDDSLNPLVYNNGKWHHIAITRENSTGKVSLYLDGILHDQQIFPSSSISTPGQVLMMNSIPGHLNVNGSISNLAFYEFALQPHQIRIRATYSIIYIIRGVVTLLGVPLKATLRFYSSFTGEFIQEIESNADSGEYLATFHNNSNVDILVFDSHDRSVRYRAYGPISPSQFSDLPIII